MSPDAINAAFELVGSFMTWRNFVQLRRDRTVAGVYWPVTAFFSVWGLWNLWYYPALGQWLSFSAGIVLCMGNIAWVILALRLRRQERVQP